MTDELHDAALMAMEARLLGRPFPESEEALRATVTDLIPPGYDLVVEEMDPHLQRINVRLEPHLDQFSLDLKVDV